MDVDDVVISGLSYQLQLLKASSTNKTSRRLNPLIDVCCVLFARAYLGPTDEKHQHAFLGASGAGQVVCDNSWFVAEDRSIY